MFVVSPRRLVALVSALVAVLVVPAAPALADDVDPGQIFFPVQVNDSLNYTDSWGDCRSGCSRRHLGVDIMTDQMTPAFAAQNGTIYAYNDYCNGEGTYCSYYLLLDGDDGRMYFYVHLNEDTPGRPNGCDHAGGLENAYSPRLYEAWQQGALKGLRVERGEHLGFVGSSGNAGCSVDHLHFEIWEGEGWDGHSESEGSINPYPPTKAAQDVGNVWGPEWPVEPIPSERVAGLDRVETAIRLSGQVHADGSVDTVVIAPATYYQEALVGAPLAATLGGPVLLAWPETNDRREAVPDALAAEIDRLGATTAVLVGAPRRLGNEVVDELVAKTGIAADDISRIGDPDPAVLSALVAEPILAAHGIEVPAEESQREAASAGDESSGPIEQADEDLRDVIDLGRARQSAVAATLAANALAAGQPTARQAATADADRAPASAEDGAEPESVVSPLVAAGTHPGGLGWPDALAASVLGSRQFAPVLLTPHDGLADAVARIVSLDEIQDVRIAGGEAAVGAEVEEDVRDLERTAERIAGADRYETSQVMAAELVDDGASLATLAVATGLDFPDALAAGPVLAQLGYGFILVHGTRNDDGVLSWLTAHASAIDLLQVIGGENAIAEDVVHGSAVAANSDN